MTEYIQVVTTVDSAEEATAVAVPLAVTLKPAACPASYLGRHEPGPLARRRPHDRSSVIVNGRVLVDSYARPVPAALSTVTGLAADACPQGTQRSSAGSLVWTMRAVAVRSLRVPVWRVNLVDNAEKKRRHRQLIGNESAKLHATSL